MIAIFDIGRTNKKTILFDERYRVVEESVNVIDEIEDDEGYGCQDLNKISKWAKQSLQDVLTRYGDKIKAVNFSAHGATFVHLNKNGEPVTPLYDYLRPLNEEVSEAFYRLFNGKDSFSLETGSPPLGMLNSGIQLFWLKRFKPIFFQKIKVSLHLPQYMNYLFTQKPHADYTSIGCHTGLWDFNNQSYHTWLMEGNLRRLLPPGEDIAKVDYVRFNEGQTLPIGIGIHDSSAALLPFIKISKDPFLLLSTGTWSITLNPFFDQFLNKSKYKRDCLYYLLNKTRKIAASRLLLGKEFEFRIRKLEQYFKKETGYFKSVDFDGGVLRDILSSPKKFDFFYPEMMQGTGPYPNLKGENPDLSKFNSFEEAYHKLLMDLLFLQKESIELVNAGIKRLYVTGGFVRNSVFMELLQAFLFDWEIFYAPKNNRASALGAALAIHEAWQEQPLDSAVVELIRYKRKSDFNLMYQKPIQVSDLY